MSSFAQKLFGVGSSSTTPKSPKQTQDASKKTKKTDANKKNVPKTRGPLLNLMLNVRPTGNGTGTVPIGPKDVVSVKN